MKFNVHIALALAVISAGLSKVEGSGGQIIDASMTNSQISLRFETTNGNSYQVQENLTLAHFVQQVGASGRHGGDDWFSRPVVAGIFTQAGQGGNRVAVRRGG